MLCIPFFLSFVRAHTTVIRKTKTNIVFFIFTLITVLIEKNIHFFLSSFARVTSFTLFFFFIIELDVVLMVFYYRMKNRVMNKKLKKLFYI